jgi:hypothetical protein
MSQPTKRNILLLMFWLVKDARANDSLFIHSSGKLLSSCMHVTDFAGRGNETKDLDGDDGDRYDEAIYPVDFRWVSHIVDDEMHKIMIQPLQPGMRLTLVFDSCHATTATTATKLHTNYKSRFKLGGKS